MFFFTEDSADFQPFNNVSCYNESVVSSMSSFVSSTSSFGSGKSNFSQPSFIDSKPTQSGIEIDSTVFLEYSTEK